MSQSDPSRSRPLTRREMREMRRREEDVRAAQAADEPRRAESAAPDAQPTAEQPRTPRPTSPVEARTSRPAPIPAPQRGEAANREDARPTADEPAPRTGHTSPHEPSRTPERDPSSHTATAAGGDSATPSTGGIEALFTQDAPHAKKRRRRGGCLLGMLVILALLGGLVTAGWWAVHSFSDTAVGSRIAEIFGIGVEPADYEEGEATGEALLTIEQNDTGWDISVALYEAGVIRTESAFYDMLVSAQQNPTFMPGVYQLQQRMTSAAALAALEDPDSRVDDAVMIPEGLTVEAIAPRIAAGLQIDEADVDAALADPSRYGVEADSLEGWLFPATYTFGPDTTAEQAVEGMVERTRESLADAGVPDDEAQRILTVASIIEREARLEEDFYRVSAVIENRLDIDMPLQMDSTAQYGIGEIHAGDVWSTEEALADDNPWNTYVHTGLPAGPIASPGDRAIDAAMHPADGDWIYFVTVNLDTGETEFASTLDEHERYTQQLREWCSANPDAGC